MTGLGEHCPGELIDEDDLAAELRAGRLWVGLDVYQREPLAADSPLRGLERLLLFPHQAGPTPIAGSIWSDGRWPISAVIWLTSLVLWRK